MTAHLANTFRTFEHDTIYDTSYSTIAWNGGGRHIERNLVYWAMQQLYDGAGIYVSTGTGMVIRGNYVGDIVDSSGSVAPPLE